MPKFTKSADGKMRASFRVEVRLSEAEYEDLKLWARRQGTTFRDVLENALYNGLEAEYHRLDEEAGAV